jgi:hypothetical protein
MKTLNTSRIATAAVALLCAGFIGMSYAAAQTARPPIATTPGQVIPLTDFSDPPDDNLAEKAAEVTRVVQELTREADKKRVQVPGDGNTIFPGAF